MPKTFAEIEAAFARALLDRFLRGAGLTAEQWAGFATAIPEDWAAAIAAETDGAVAVSDWPNVIHRPRVLHKRLPRARTNEMMSPTTRLAIAEGHGDKRDKEWRATLRKAGLSQNALAAKLGISKGMLSRHRRKRSEGGEPCPSARAAAIHKLTGWPAKDEPRYWPAGLS